ncbi:MAG: formylglycine-generating enzyme family protein, partial [Planctomycetota bacterium]
MKTHLTVPSFIGVWLLCTSPAGANVFDMGPDLTDLEFVSVGDPGNVDDTQGDGYGGVGYVYNIGTYEVTNAQYVEFLNAVATDDTYELYSESMWTHSIGCKIQRSGSPGSFSYIVAADRANRPVNFTNWGDAARFANWLTNGQPVGAQDATTTEDGSYALNGAITDQELVAVTRRPDARYVIPSEDEWYKAAYYKGGGAASAYWSYATQSDNVPNNGNPEGDTGNSANYDDGDYTIGSPYWMTEAGWFGSSESAYGTFDQNGNVFEFNESVESDSYRVV